MQMNKFQDYMALFLFIIVTTIEFFWLFLLQSFYSTAKYVTVHKKSAFITKCDIN